MLKGQTPLPEAFLHAMRAQLGTEAFDAYLRAMEQPYARGLRVNLLRRPDGTLPCAIEGIDGRIPWAQGAYFITKDARPGLDPLHEGGLYYMQEPSAMAAAQLLSPRPGERVLDLCAAPGGKSTQIAALMRGEGILLANEIIPSRAQILSRNIERMGVRNAIVTCAAPDALSERLPLFFDAVLVDAPCSGEGMFRRQEEARAQWTEQSPALCAARQRDILRHAARMVRPGGRLVYSTCTFNTVENDEVVHAFLDEWKDFELTPFALPGLEAAKEGTLHLYPHRMRAEGHFIALFRRRDDQRATDVHTTRLIPDVQAQAAWEAFYPEVLAPKAHFAHVRRIGDTLYDLPEGMPDLRGIRVLRSGLCLGHVKGRRIEPDHALAMALTPEEAARCAALTREEAFAYQHGEGLPASEGVAKGYALATLEGCPLGFVKCADGFFKNHYPKGLRR